MAQRFPLQLLLERAHDELAAVTRQLGHAQRERTDAQTQLDALLRYRDDYYTNFSVAAQAGMPAGNWRNFQAFIDTLDAAIGQQRRVLAAADARVDEARPAWQAKKRMLGAYQTLQARGAQQEAHGVAKREQRDADEYAANALRLRAAAAK